MNYVPPGQSYPGPAYATDTNTASMINAALRNAYYDYKDWQTDKKHLQACRDVTEIATSTIKSRTRERNAAIVGMIIIGGALIYVAAKK